jgi:DNA polymerase V
MNPSKAITGEVSRIDAFEQRHKLETPMFLVKISAGFPSPADDYIDGKIDLNEHLVAHPAATFFVRVEGDSMKDAGIFSGDILVVDRSLEARQNSVIVAILNGEFTVKHFCLTEHGVTLVPANTAYSPVKISDEMDFEVWGVVTNVIHSFSH